MVPTAVAEMGNKLRHPNYVQTQKFAQMKDLSVCQKSRLDSHVNSTATVRSLLKSDHFHSSLSFRLLSSSGRFQRSQRNYRFRQKCKWLCLSQFCLPVRVLDSK